MTTNEDLHVSNRMVLSRREPFVYGYVDNYLEPDVYEHLSEGFPDESVYVNYDDHESAALADHPGWRRLLDMFSSRAFWTDLNSVFDDAAAFDTETEFRVTFKLSSLKRGEWVQPHTDNPRKIVSLILYLTPPKWDPAFGGGTEVYEPKSRLLKRNWHSVDVPFDWMRLRETIDYVPNRLVVLVKSADSWHGVSPIQCPDDLRRNTLLVTLQHAGEVEGLIQRRVFRYLRRRSVKLIRARMRRRI